MSGNLGAAIAGAIVGGLVVSLVVALSALAPTMPTLPEPPSPACVSSQFPRGTIVRLKGLPGTEAMVTGPSDCGLVSVRTKDYLWVERVGADYLERVPAPAIAPGLNEGFN